MCSVASIHALSIPNEVIVMSSGLLWHGIANRKPVLEVGGAEFKMCWHLPRRKDTCCIMGNVGCSVFLSLTMLESRCTKSRDILASAALISTAFFFSVSCKFSTKLLMCTFNPFFFFFFYMDGAICIKIASFHHRSHTLTAGISATFAFFHI